LCGNEKEALLLLFSSPVSESAVFYEEYLQGLYLMMMKMV